MRKLISKILALLVISNFAAAAVFADGNCGSSVTTPTSQPIAKGEHAGKIWDAKTQTWVAPR